MRLAGKKVKENLRPRLDFGCVTRQVVSTLKHATRSRSTVSDRSGNLPRGFRAAPKCRPRRHGICSILHGYLVRLSSSNNRLDELVRLRETRGKIMDGKRTHSPLDERVALYWGACWLLRNGELGVETQRTVLQVLMAFARSDSSANLRRAARGAIENLGLPPAPSARRG